MEIGSSVFGFAQSVGKYAVKVVRRANTAERLRNGSQLFVLQPEHWLFPSLCQYKRHRRERDIAELRRQYKGSLDAVKAKLLGKLLAGSKGPCASTDGLLEAVLAITSIVYSMHMQFEPFLVEVGLVHCVAAWSDRAGSAADVQGFEAFLLEELARPQAANWFNCQFFFDENGLLGLAPLFYKERVTHQVARDLIALCVSESSNDLWACSDLLIKRFAKEKNKTAFDAWMVWVADNFAMVGSPRGVEDAGPKSLAFMGQYVMNATQLDANRRAYIAIGMHNPNFVTCDFYNLRGVILDRKAEGNARIKNTLCIYEGSAK